MSEETAFLETIRLSPLDDTARLVYADWLDEQGDPTSKSKADFIRLEIRMATSPELSLNRIRWLNQVRKLAVALDENWLGIVSHPKLEACRLSTHFECPKQWEALSPTRESNVRFCESCKREVYYCMTLREARGHVVRGDCVAVTLALIRRPNDVRQSQLPPEPVPTDPFANTLVGFFDLLPPAPAKDEPIPAREEPRRPRSSRRKSKRSRRRTRSIERDHWERGDQWEQE